MTAHILSTRYETICATNGEEAIEIYKKERPNMILSDLNMPGMSGFELQNTLQDMYCEHIPVMFMTADNSDDTESQGFENGAVDYIRKPFRADVLLRRVENILKNVEKIQGLKRAADTDPMTGLLNKASSQFEIGEAASKTQGMLMMIDLDSFKLVNDLYGHAMGDKVLIRFAEIIKSAVRSADIVGRMGGDEFIAFCQYVTEEEVVAEKTKYINEELLIEDSSENGIQREIAILSERNRKKGAMVLPNEQFRLIYQFLARAEINYHRENKLALFTVKENEGVRLKDEPAKLLIDVMAQSLRSSDVVTQRSKNTVAVILLEASPVDTGVVIERMLGKWNEMDTGLSITYEVEQIG